MRGLTLKQLRIVAAIARTGRVVSAAEVVGTTPPAVTLQLRQLEDRLGLILFERTRGGMRLTEAGALLLDAATRVDGVLTGTEEALDALRGLRRGRVTVGVVSTAKYFAPGALGGFHGLEPGVDLKLIVGNRAEMIAALAAFDCDLVVMGAPPEGLAVESVVIGDHPHVVIAAPKHPLARRTRLTLADLAEESFVMREPGSGTRSLMTRIFAEAALTPRVGMEMESNETIKQAVMAGLGVAFISGHTIAAEVESGRLAVLDIDVLPARREWRIVRHADKPVTPAAAGLWAFLKEEGGQYLPPILRHVRARRQTSQ